MINQINENISQQNDSTRKKILFTDNKLDFEKQTHFYKCLQLN